MVNGPEESRAAAEQSDRRIPLQGARAKLVNSGHDTEITLSDGSIIVFKGITHVEAVSVFSGAPAFINC